MARRLGVLLLVVLAMAATAAPSQSTTQDTLGLCCVSFDHLFSVPLPHQPAPGTKVCAQQAHREAFSDGLDVDFSVPFTNRVCLVMPAASPGELPFTGPTHTVPLGVFAALAIELGAVVLHSTRGRQQRSQ
jgi:hypothetical protein